VCESVCLCEFFCVNDHLAFLLEFGLVGAAGVRMSVWVYVGVCGYV